MCLLGGLHRGYPRSSVLVSGLRRLGVPVEECVASPKHKAPRRYAGLVRAYRRTPGNFDVIFVPEFRHKDVPLAWALSRAAGALCVFDPLVSRYDTRVHDRRDVDAAGLQAGHNLNLDRFAMSLADLVLADTSAHAAYFRERLVAPGTPVHVVPVGYDDDLFTPLPRAASDDRVEVLFYGSYLPLHGSEVIVEAAARLRAERDIRFTLIGGGQTFAQAERRARELPNVSLEPRVEASLLPRRIAAADICLGIFGTTDKAARVVPNKVYQCMGMDRAVVTADTPAAREFFEDGRHAVLVAPGDAGALARAILALARDAPARARIGACAGAHVRARFSPVPIARRLVALCDEAMS
jgi:glycosyltransferase involved in cell wall biosynthesis